MFQDLQTADDGLEIKRKTEKEAIMKSTLKYVWGVATLRPHGRNLLLPSAEYWFLFMSVVIFLMAGLEATTWGLIGFYVIPKPYNVPATVISSLLIFLLIWMIDVTFVLLDFSQATRIEKNKDHHGLIVKTLLKIPIKLVLMVAMRLVIIAVSLAFTAPNFSEVLLSRDISAEMLGLMGQERSNLLNRTIAKHQDETTDLQKKLDSLSAEYTAEIAGIGLSKRHGEGATAKSIKDRMDQIKERLKVLEQERDMELSFVKEAKYAAIAERYALPKFENTFTERKKMHHALLRKDEQYNTIEWIARCIVIIIVSVLFGFKFLQSHAVHIYLNDHLQELYLRYLRGEFNSMLAKGNRPNGESPLSSYAFEEWICGSYERIREDTEMRKLKAEIDDLAAQLNEFSSNIGAQVKPVLDEIKLLSDEEDNTRNEIDSLENEKSFVVNEINEIEEKILAFDLDTLPKADYAEAIKEKCRLRNKIERLTHQQSENRIKANEVLKKLSKNSRRIKELQEQIGQKIEFQGEIEEKLFSLLKTYLEKRTDSILTNPRLALVVAVEMSKKNIN